MNSRSGYSWNEDVRMLKWVARNSSESPLGIQIWNKYVGHYSAEHTAQSLNGRMRRVVIPNFCDYIKSLSLSELEVLYNTFRLRLNSETSHRVKCHIKKLREQEKSTPVKGNYRRVVPPDDDMNDDEEDDRVKLENSNDVSTTIHSDDDDEITSSTHFDVGSRKEPEDSRGPGPSSTSSSGYPHRTPNFKKFNTESYSRDQERGAHNFVADSDADSFANWTPRNVSKFEEHSRAHLVDDADSDCSIQIPDTHIGTGECSRIDLKNVSSRVLKMPSERQEELDSDDSWKSPKQSRRFYDFSRIAREPAKKFKKTLDKRDFPDDSDDSIELPKTKKKMEESPRNVQEENDSDASTIPVKSPEKVKKVEEYSRDVPAKQLPDPENIDSDDTELIGISEPNSPSFSPKQAPTTSRREQEELPVAQEEMPRLKTPEKDSLPSTVPQQSPTSPRVLSVAIREEVAILAEDEFDDDDDYVSPAPSPTQRMDITSYFGVEMDDDDESIPLPATRVIQKVENFGEKTLETFHQSTEIFESSPRQEEEVEQESVLRSPRSPKKRMTNNSQSTQIAEMSIRSPATSKSPKKSNDNHPVVEQTVEVGPRKLRKRAESTGQPYKTPSTSQSARNVKNNSEIIQRKIAQKSSDKRRRGRPSMSAAGAEKTIMKNSEIHAQEASIETSSSPKKTVENIVEVFQMTADFSEPISPTTYLNNNSEVLQQEEDEKLVNSATRAPEKEECHSALAVQQEVSEVRSPSPKKLMDDPQPVTIRKTRDGTSDSDDLAERILETIRQREEMLARTETQESVVQSEEVAGSSLAEHHNEVDRSEAPVAKVPKESFRTHPAYLKYAHLPPKDDKQNYYWIKKKSGVMCWKMVPKWIMDGLSESPAPVKHQRWTMSRKRRKRKANAKESEESEEDNQQADHEIDVEVSQAKLDLPRPVSPAIEMEGFAENGEGAESSAQSKQGTPEGKLPIEPEMEKITNKRDDADDTRECSTSVERKPKNRTVNPVPKRSSARRVISEDPQINDNKTMSEEPQIDEKQENKLKVGESSTVAGGKRKSPQNRRKSGRVPRKNMRKRSITNSPTPDDCDHELDDELNHDKSLLEQSPMEDQGEEEEKRPPATSARKRNYRRKLKDGDAEEEEGGMFYYTIDLLGRQRKWRKNPANAGKPFSRARLAALRDKAGECSSELPKKEVPPVTPKTPKIKRGRPSGKLNLFEKAKRNNGELMEPFVLNNDHLPGTSSGNTAVMVDRSTPSCSTNATKQDVDSKFSFEAWNAKIRPVTEGLVSDLYRDMIRSIEGKTLTQKGLEEVIKGENMQELFDEMFRVEKQQSEDSFVIVKVPRFTDQKLRFKCFSRIKDELKKMNVAPHIRSAVLAFFLYFEYTVAATIDGKNFETYTVLLEQIFEVAIKIATHSTQ